MTSARYWHGGRLVAGWIVALGGLFLFHRALLRGVYETVLEDQQVTRIGGYWSGEVATLITAVAAGIVVGVLAWLTVSWLLGRRDRAALRANTVPVHRRILM